MLFLISIINDCSHVGYTIYKELLRRGLNVQYLPRSRGFRGKTLNVLINTLKAKGLIHVNYALQDAYLTARLKHLDVLHCHGSDIRNMEGKWGWVAKYNLKVAKKVIVSTPDLLEIAKAIREDAEWLPNPIDLDFFKPANSRKKDEKRALYFLKPNDVLKEDTKLYLENNGYQIDILPRTFSYELMPQIYNKYTCYIDRTNPPSISKSALEAMACGLSVYHWNGRLTDGGKNKLIIEKIFSSKRVVDRLLKIYSEI